MTMTDYILLPINASKGSLINELTHKVVPRTETDFGKEALWLFGGLLLCALMIIGCACCSLRFTRLQQRRRLAMEDAECSADGLRPKYSFNGVSGGSFGGVSMGAEISCDFENSVDLTSSSAAK